MMKRDSKIYVAGQKSFISSAVVRRLRERGYKKLLTKKGLDLLSQKAVDEFFKNSKPEYVFLSSIKSGGILANTRYPAEFLYDNLISQINVIHSAFKYDVKKLLFLGSACSYPKFCPQPIKEKYLLTGIIEPTNEPYAIAKISGLKMCEAYNRQYKKKFIPAIPTNIYGPEDDFTECGHVVSSLINKFHKAKIFNQKEVKIWGTGKPKREFLYVDDIADACIFLMNKYNNSEIINIGGGKEVSIEELASFLKQIIGFEGKVVYDTSKPDGMPRRLLDPTKIKKLGWKPQIPLEEGLQLTYNWYIKNQHFSYEQ